MKQLILLLAFVPLLATATDKKKPPPPMEQEQYQKATSESIAKAGATSASAAEASNEGNNLTVSTSVEAPAPDIVLVPNNNTANCMKVYGLSFSNTSGGGGIGWPYRDKSCDFEQAADDASAHGQHIIAWYWRCHKKNLYKQFNGRAKHKEQQIQACHQRMTQMFVIIDAEPKPVECPPDDHPDIHNRIFAACVKSK